MRASTFFLLHLLIILCVTRLSSANVRFNPGTAYRYRYVGHTELGALGTIMVNAELVIIPLSPQSSENRTQLCRLVVKHYNLAMDHAGVDYLPRGRDTLDFSKWMSFSISHQGEVKNIYYNSKDENTDVVVLKKILIGSLSSKLIVSDQNWTNKKRWGYQVTESAHEGEQTSIYHAEPQSHGIIFTKTRTSKIVENAEQSHVKTVHFVPRTGVMKRISLKEHFVAPNKPADGFTTDTKGETREAMRAADKEIDLSHLRGSGEAEFRLLAIDADVVNKQHHFSEMPRKLKTDTLAIQKLVLPPIPLSAIKDDIESNFSCVVTEMSPKDLPGNSNCFPQLVKLLKRLEMADLQNLTQIYMSPTKALLARKIFVDALGTMETKESHQLTRTYVFLARPPESDLLTQAMVHFIEWQEPPPMYLLDILEDMAFDKPFTFPDKRVTRKVQNSATLVLGAMADKLKTAKPSWSARIVESLHTRAGVHDPWHHRHIRSTMQRQPLRDHLHRKATYVLAIGNAAGDSSFDLLCSYLNVSDVTDSHILLRSSAVQAIAQIQHQEAADKLMEIALTDRHENVRRAAVERYKKHPRGGDLAAVLGMEHRSVNITAEEHKRVRRSIGNVIARIWQGFHFTIATPEINWDKGIGGEKLGASFGLICKNELDIKVAPLSGHLEVDVFDTAFATISLGIINIKFDLFRVELCYNGRIEYDLNILKEYGFDDILKIAKIFTTRIPKVVDLIKSSVTTFRQLVNTYQEFDPREIIDNLVTAIRDLPSKVLNLRKVAQLLWKASSKFVNLPPVVDDVKELVMYVKHLFNDIKTDIMTFYNAIVDAVTVTVPWAWTELKTAFNGIVEAVKNIIRNPKTAVQNIGREVSRIAAAVSVVVEAKNKILEANIFAKDNRPYWSDLPKMMRLLERKLTAIKHSYTETVNWLKGNATLNDIAKRLTGHDLSELKKQALAEVIRILDEELAGPITYLKMLLKPFQMTNDLFNAVVTNVKTAWPLIVEGYEEARSIIQMIFGPRLHKEFPRKYLLSSSCGNGFWESDGRGTYEEPGVQLNISAGTELVAPFNGKLVQLDQNKITIIPEGLKDVEVVVTNVQTYEHVIDTQVGAGDPIGLVTQVTHCADNHIHFSMRKYGTQDYIDPSRYMEKREMKKPEWVESCDHYLVVIMNKVIASGEITSDAEVEDETPDIENAPDVDNIIEPMSTRSKRSVNFNNPIESLADYTKSLGLPDFSRISEIFSFSMNNITLGKIISFLDSAGLVKEKNKILNIIDQIQGRMDTEQCTNPGVLEDEELKKALLMRGKSTQGPRKTLEARFMENERRCARLGSKLPKNAYCQFDDNCLGMSCCLDLEVFVFRYALVAHVRLDPWNMTLTLGLDRWVIVIPLTEDTAIDGSTPVLQGTDIMSALQITVKYSVRVTDRTLNITLGASWCSTRIEECLPLFIIFEGIEMSIPSDVTLPPINEPVLKRGKERTRARQLGLTALPSGLSNLKIGDFIKLVDNSRLDDKILTELILNLREAFQLWVEQQIKGLLIKIFGNEFDRFDMCMKGPVISFGPIKTLFFRPPPYTIWIGPVPIDFRVSVYGYYGSTFQAELCLLTMKAVARVTPNLAVSVEGSVEVPLMYFKAALVAEAKLLTTLLPAKAEVEFHKFPLDIRGRLDLVMVPVTITIYARLTFSLGIIHIILLNFKIFSFSTPAIEKNLFNYNDAEPDRTPPDFSIYSRAKCDSTCSRRRRRSLPYYKTNRCHVEQIEGRDYTEPAVNIELAIDDDRSEIQMIVSVGTFVGGRDVLNEEPLGGGSNILSSRMVSGIPLYFMVTASDSMGLSSQATCVLDTYDTTLPVGRVSPEFLLTSHPNIIRASLKAWDDTPITIQRASVGYGKDWAGIYIVDWHMVETAAVGVPSPGHDPHGLGHLASFTAGRLGRLSWRPFLTLTYAHVQQCAEACLARPLSSCLSFCYDYGNSGECALYNDLEGESVELHKSRQFQYFERLGVGGVYHLRYDNLQLYHNTLVFVNVYLHNRLGYENIISSAGIQVDLTPPLPGQLGDVTQDEIRHEDCKSYVPPDLHYLCSHDTPAPNHRHVVDGKGSKTIFNGYYSLRDSPYSRSKRLIAANWDGIHDDESGVLLYSWAVGKHVCGDDIRPYTDPHEHLNSDTEWRHVGVAFPLSLQDGSYYVSVRAINKVQFGGPMALTVCHSVPYIIDSTPPILNGIYDTTYDKETLIFRTTVNTSDAVSGIKGFEFGLGRSRRDTLILDWTDVGTNNPIEFHFQIPDGVPVFVRVRVTNHAGLQAATSALEHILVDFSPPDPGTVYDGDQPGISKAFQTSANTYCVNWEHFQDPHSGIMTYTLSAGSETGLDDIIGYKEFPSTTTQYCEDKLHLKHASKCYAMVTAFNGANPQLSTSATSEGVYVDTTPPSHGWVKDGLTLDEDLAYSGDPSTVSAIFGGFGDPESGVKKIDILVYRRLAGASEETVIHKEMDLTNTTNTISLRHFNLKDRDLVRVKVNVTNNADSSTSAMSDGFTVDLTKPVLNSLVDGTDIKITQRYTVSTSSLSAAWDIYDDNSGIDHYRIAAYEVQGLTRKHVYPSTAAWEELSDRANSFTTSEPITLIDGLRYSISVSAVNKAGLVAVYNTPGVIVDSTPPSVLWVRVGVLDGNSEELIDGYVIQSDLHGIKAQWFGTDAGSGIVEYSVAVGTNPGSTDVSNFQSVEKISGLYIGDLDLEKTDLTKNEPIYYVMVKAVNGAGQESIVTTSSPIKVIPGDVSGVVFVGPVAGETIRYQSDSTTVTFNFRGFESAQFGIEAYEWSVGTSPGWDDVLSYSTYGLLQSQNTGSGKGQAMAALTPGIEYFVNVRATTGAGEILESSSESFIVDVTSPDITVDTVGNIDIDNSGHDQILYQTDHDWYTATWTTTEDESELATTTYVLNTYPGSPQSESSGTTEDTALSLGSLRLVGTGLPNVLTLHESNVVDLVGTAVFPTLIVDQSPPIPGIVQCQQYIQDSTDIRCEWHGFMEEESTIDYYHFGIGRNPGHEDLFSFFKRSSRDNEITVSQIGADLEHGKNYYATVVAVNTAGLSARALSNPIHVDNSPPVGGLVVVLPDAVSVEVGDEDFTILDNAHDSYEVSEEMAAICQRSQTQVKVAWQPFHDLESSVIRYEVALGSSAGKSDIHSFKEVSDEGSAVLRGLDLSSIRQVYASVRGTNAAGLKSTATSQPVFISRISAGLPSLGMSIVYDGNLQGIDLDYQNRDDILSANWDFTGDPCPIETYQWAIYRTDGTVVIPMETLPTGSRKAEADMKEIQDGESFFVVVRATNKLGYSYSVSSDGITIKVEPLLPGVVRDGPTPGVDLSTQLSVTTLSGNWDGFGVHWHREHSAVIGVSDNDICIGKESTECYHIAAAGSKCDYHEKRPSPVLLNSQFKLQDDPGADMEIGYHQTIDHYEVAAGTGRLNSDTRQNIRSFVNVGLNQEWTFSDLNLIPKTVVYFITVRAYSITGNMAEVVSNGIRTGIDEDEIVSEDIEPTGGQIYLRRFIESTHQVSLYWKQFRFPGHLDYYKLGIGDSDNILPSLECDNIKEDFQFSSIFNIKPLTKVGKDTFIKLTGLTMQHDAEYQVVVMGTDILGNCAMATGIFHVDITPPTLGTVGAGRFFQSVFYIDTSTSLAAWWEGYDDPESGIEKYEVALYRSQTCKTGNETLIQDFVAVPSQENSFTFWLIQLESDEVYYLHFAVTNMAGIRVEVLSDPILIDVEPARSGRIQDGHDFKSDLVYQSSTTHLKGVFVYIPLAEYETCPWKWYSMDTLTPWKKIVHKRVWGVDGPNHGQITFYKEQVKISEDGMVITMVRDTRYAQIRSAAVQIDADILYGGDYQFEIKAGSGDLRAVTSVVFWDGPKGVFGDYAIQDFRLYEDPEHEDEDDTIVIEVDGDTSGDAADGNPMRASFGFQIHPNATYRGKPSNYIVLWTWGDASNNRTVTMVTDLGFDPTEDWHQYTLVINKKNMLKAWELELQIDGKLKAMIGGGTPLSESAEILLGLYNRYDWVPELDDIFNPKQTRAGFKNIKLPPDAEELCRYGRPFTGGHHIFQDFKSAVGTSPGSDDIASFTSITDYCEPCQPVCPGSSCDVNCPLDQEQVVKFTIEGLNLTPNIFDPQTNSIMPIEYYLTVEAVTASGRKVVGSTNGIVIDITPPIISNVYHVDMGWSLDNTTLQGNDSTIAVFWHSDDLQSEVAHTWWSIGTSPGGAELQPLTYIGTNESGINENLRGLLQHDVTYYATIICQNRAGLTTTAYSGGVTMYLTLPSLYNATIRISNTLPLDDARGYVIRDQNQLEMDWSCPQCNTLPESYMGCEDTAIKVHHWGVKPLVVDSAMTTVFSIGTHQENADIFPKTAFNVTTKGHLELSIEGLKINGKAQELPIGENVTMSLEEYFFLEPGRPLVIHLEVCNKVHRCVKMPVDPVIIQRETDRSSTRVDKLELYVPIAGRIITILATESQVHGTKLFGGALSRSDVTREYKSDVSVGFKPYIVNPEETINSTSAYLENRLDLWHGYEFYLSTLPHWDIDGQLDINMPFDKGLIKSEVGPFKPHLLTWCPGSEQWVDAERTCYNRDEKEIKWSEASFRIRICSSKLLCGQNLEDSSGQEGEVPSDEVPWNETSSTVTPPTVKPSTTVPETQKDTFAGPAFFAVATIYGDYINQPPVITSPDKIEIFQDQRTVVIQLFAHDPEGENIMFSLEGSPNSNASVTLEPDGRLTYSPSENWHGTDVLYYTVTEVRWDSEPPLSTNGSLTVIVIPIDEFAELMLLVNGVNVMSSSYMATFTVDERVYHEAPDYIEAVVVAYSEEIANTLEILFYPTEHGNFSLTQDVYNVTLMEEQCNVSPEEFDLLWAEFLKFMKSGTETAVLPLACHNQSDVLRKPTTKTLSSFTYVPKLGFYGDDVAKIIARDQTGAYSSLLTVTITVLPCKGENCSAGVPDVSNSTTGINGSSTIDYNNSTQAYIIPDQEILTMSWDVPDDDNSPITSMSFGMGTDADNCKVFPKQSFPYSNRGSLELTSSGLTIYRDVQESKIQFADRSKRSTAGKYFVEPGRTLRIHLEACNEAVICEDIPTYPIIISRSGDVYSQVENVFSQIFLTITIPKSENNELTIRTATKQEGGAGLLGGVLTEDDLHATYSSFADPFLPYVVDPVQTITRAEPKLKDRIKSWLGVDFYLNTLPDLGISGPLVITIPFSKTSFGSDTGRLKPQLLAWCSDLEIWVDAGRTCHGVDRGNIDWDKELLEVQVCSTKALCDRTALPNARRKRALSAPGFAGPAAFSLASVFELPINENLDLMMLLDGINVMSPTNRFNFIIEQNSVLETVVVAYSETTMEHLGVELFNHPYSGNSTLTQPVHDVIVISEECDRSKDEFDQRWEQLLESLKSAAEMVFLPLACESNAEALVRSTTRTAVLFSYQPDPDFCGEDIVHMVAKDANGYYSYKLEVQITVRCNLCVHGRCRGPPGDEDCNSYNRSQGFEGYECSCDKGYTGVTCAQLDSSTLQDWHVVLITFMTIIALSLLAVVVACVYRKSCRRLRVVSPLVQKTCIQSNTSSMVTLKSHAEDDQLGKCNPVTFNLSSSKYPRGSTLGYSVFEDNCEPEDGVINEDTGSLDLHGYPIINDVNEHLDETCDGDLSNVRRLNVTPVASDQLAWIQSTRSLMTTRDDAHYFAWKQRSRGDNNQTRSLTTASID